MPPNKPPSSHVGVASNSDTRLKIEQYVKAATRSNTRRSYKSAVQHFEESWGGFLPSTGDQVARYLADNAENLSISTLKHRVAALAVWHKEQGFPDPTKAPVVKKVLKGIRELHPHNARSAKPLQIDQLAALNAWISERISKAEKEQDHKQIVTWSRNRAILLVGFWRAFRSDELCRMNIEHTQADINTGISIFLPRSKSDQNNNGRTFHTPALKHLCPVQAYRHWISASNLTSGPVYRKISRWGHISDKPLNPNSIIPMLRDWLEQAKISGAESFSSHSLRRGFATWANENQWDLKALMEYVGWKDVKSAMRYIEIKAPFQDLAHSSLSNQAKIIAAKGSKK